MDPAATRLSALRAFAAAARHGSFTRAAAELCVTQAAVSHQIRGLEARLGVSLFRRASRGLVLTDEGHALAPALIEGFGTIERALAQFEAGGLRSVLAVGAVGTFAVGFLLERLPAFRAAHPAIDLRLFTHNNKVDLAADGLDYAIRFGDGAWANNSSEPICTAPLAPLCTRSLAAQLREPRDLIGTPLLRSYRAGDWAAWFRAAGVTPGSLSGPLFDSSHVMVQAALRGDGVALAPPSMFGRELGSGALVQPFPIAVDVGRYWLSRLASRDANPPMRVFRTWLLTAAGPSALDRPDAGS